MASESLGLAYTRIPQGMSILRLPRLSGPSSLRPRSGSTPSEIEGSRALGSNERGLLRIDAERPVLTRP